MALVGLFVTVYLLSIPLVEITLRRTLQVDPPLASIPEAQAIVILGGGVVNHAPEYGSPFPSAATLVRVHYGAYLQKLTGLPVLVSGGGHPASEAEGMARALQDEGVALDKIWLEAESGTTYENAVMSQGLLAQHGVKRIVLVTQAFHMWRSRLSFEATGLSVVPAPCDFAGGDPLERGAFAVLPQAVCLYRSSVALEEWGCLAFYRLRYWR